MRKETEIRTGRHCVFNMHVHLLINYPPKVAITSLVNSLKRVSSRMIRKNLWGNHLWSPSYFAGSCGGATIAIIKQYIEQQQTPH